MKFVLPDPSDLSEADKAKLKSLGEATFYEEMPATEEEVIQRIDGAEMIAVSWINVTENIIRSSPNLKYIVVLAVGYDQIDLKAASVADVKVINCPTHNALAVAEYTIGLIFAVTRRILEANLFLREGNWNQQRFRGVELRGKQLGLIGYGNSGREVEKLAIALGMHVSHATSKTSPTDLDRLIATSDILSLHLPLTEQSRHLIDERRLNLLKPSAYLINTARGAIVDQQALIKILNQKRIAGAALDVFEDEPVSGLPTREMLELIRLGNVVATPHIAYNSEEMAARLGAELIANIQACIEGKPINVVN
ncbi:MAG: 3-phosphoglycerate dehydrogenase [Leptolyngbyaceae cyanobacterium SL_5_9]|nr:3-phosphoglycerate dehydrogenase [Leptolyngbyaceae cyanobacterium SL_5_9]NJO74777.1 3-phosphoglycerate dehydrogenase [Leptolyngbyaceae cyanobacterium RM1_406_9]